MKIMIMTLRVPFPLTDGGAIAMYGLIEKLSQSGHQLTIAALNTQKHYYDPNVLSPFGRVETTDVDTTPRLIPAIRSFLWERNAYNIQRFDVPAHHDLLKKILYKNKFDIVQLEGVYLAHYIPTIRRMTDTPIVLRAHNVEYKIWEKYAQQEPNILKRFYFSHLAKRGKYFEKKSLPLTDGVITFTKTDAEHYRKLGYSGLLEVISAGYNVPKDLPNVKVQPNTLAFMGSLEWLPNRQGLDWFIKQVYPHILKASPNTTLHIAGKNPPSYIEEYANEHIIFHGYVPDAGEFLKDKAVVIVPLLSGSGIRIKILEGLSNGKCIVSTTLGADGTDTIHGHQLLLADDPIDFANHVINVLQDESLRIKLSQKGREHAIQHFGWDQVLSCLEAFYQRLV
jgi:glycosyltransferase involved in cell wall biosynthesis